MRLILVVYKGVACRLSDIVITFIDAEESAPIPWDGARYSLNGTMQRYVCTTCVGLCVADHQEIIGVPRESATDSVYEWD